MSITLSIIKKFLESTVYLYKTMEKQIIARFWTVSQLVWNREVALWFLASLKVDHNMEPSLLLYTKSPEAFCTSPPGPSGLPLRLSTVYGKSFWALLA